MNDDRYPIGYVLGDDDDDDEVCVPLPVRYPWHLRKR
jgi:hypothetical protein